MIKAITGTDQYNDLYSSNFVASSMQIEWAPRVEGTRSALNLVVRYISTWSKQRLTVSFYDINQLSIVESMTAGCPWELILVESIHDQQMASINYKAVGAWEQEEPFIEFLCDSFCAVLEDYSL